MGRRIWVAISGYEKQGIIDHVYDCRVLSFKQFLPAGGERKRHLVQVWTDPGGMRTLSVGSIRLKDPNRVEGARQRAARERAAAEQSLEDD